MVENVDQTKKRDRCVSFFSCFSYDIRVHSIKQGVFFTVRGFRLGLVSGSNEHALLACFGPWLRSLCQGSRMILGLG